LFRREVVGGLEILDCSLLTSKVQPRNFYPYCYPLRACHKFLLHISMLLFQLFEHVCLSGVLRPQQPLSFCVIKICEAFVLKTSTFVVVVELIVLHALRLIACSAQASSAFAQAMADDLVVAAPVFAVEVPALRESLPSPSGWRVVQLALLAFIVGGSKRMNWIEVGGFFGLCWF
jgi:hypothetical protein